MQSIYDGLDNSKDPKQRDYCSMCVFGDLGKGKSTFIRQQAKFYIERTRDKKVPRKVLICDPSRATAFDEFPQITLTELKYGVINPQTRKAQRWDRGIRVLRNVKWKDPSWFQILSTWFRNGLVILDESRNYIPQKSEMPEEQIEFFTIHRNNCTDVMVVSHDFMSMNLLLRKAFRIYIVFRTGDKPNHEAWFTTRTLPEELYAIWSTLQRLRSPAAKMSPFVLYDRETGRTKLYADLDKLEILVPDPENSTLYQSIPYRKFKGKQTLINKNN